MQLLLLRRSDEALEAMTLLNDSFAGLPKNHSNERALSSFPQLDLDLDQVILSAFQNAYLKIFVNAYNGCLLHGQSCVHHSNLISKILGINNSDLYKKYVISI